MPQMLPQILKSQFANYHTLSMRTLTAVMEHEHPGAYSFYEGRLFANIRDCFNGCAAGLKAIRIFDNATSEMRAILPGKERDFNDFVKEFVAAVPPDPRETDGISLVSCRIYCRHAISGITDADLEALTLDAYRQTNAQNETAVAAQIGSMFTAFAKGASDVLGNLLEPFSLVIPVAVGSSVDKLAGRAGLQGTPLKETLRYSLASLVAGGVGILTGAGLLPAAAAYGAIKTMSTAYDLALLHLKKA